MEGWREEGLSQSKYQLCVTIREFVVRFSETEADSPRSERSGRHVLVKPLRSGPPHARDLFCNDELFLFRITHSKAQIRCTMPSSKRAKVIHLSKNPSSAAQKKTCKIQAQKLYDNIRHAIPRYAYAYVFAVDNMRNTYLKDVRSELVDSRYVLCL